MGRPRASLIVEYGHAMELTDGRSLAPRRSSGAMARRCWPLRLESELDGAVAAEQARAAIALLACGGEVHWSVDVEAAGVIVRQWGFAPGFAATLAALSRALDGLGVEGRLLSHAPEPEPVRTPGRRARLRRLDRDARRRRTGIHTRPGRHRRRSRPQYAKTLPRPETTVSRERRQEALETRLRS
jgi:hypothetical protein